MNTARCIPTVYGSAIGGLALAGLLSATPHIADAQTGARSGFALEEVIVTARRREERLQETPVAVTVLSGDELTQRMVTDLAQMGDFVPNLQFDTGTQSSRASFVSAIFIRGIGQPDFIVTTDPGVGIYVDGVYYARTTGGVLDLLDIERIEVLRGPQGTLFGKNTIGGALNVVSSQPDGELSGTLELTHGRFDRIDFRGDLNLPLSDKVYAGLAVSTKHSDGFGKQIDFATRRTAAETGEDDSVTGRGRLRWIVNEDLEANVSVDYTRIREPQVPQDIVRIDPTAGLAGLWNALVGGPSGQPYTPVYLTPGNYASYGTGGGTADLDAWGVSLTLDWDLGPYALKSITAYRSTEALFSNDGDGSPLRVLGSDVVDLDQDQVSQELHLSGAGFDGRLDWLLGFYYFEESAVEDTAAFVMPGIYQSLEASPFLLGPAGPLGPCPPPAAVAALPTPGPLGCMGNPNNIPLDLDFFGINDVEITNYSVFAHGTYALTDRWSFTAGARYIYEEKVHDIFYMRRNSGFVIAPTGTVEEESWSEVTPKVGLEFQPTDDVLLYVSASRGFRSGGFNGRPFFREVVESFDPEFVWAYEVGAKTQWLNRRLTANLAVFYNDYTDVQLTANRATADGNVGVFTENGGEAEIKGFELELHARPVENLDLILGVGYTDAEFTSIAPNVSITEDNEFLKTPEWDINVGAQYRWPVAFGAVTLRGDYAYRSEWWNDVVNSPGLKQDSIDLVNARIAFTPNSGTWEVAAFGTNLTDEQYITGGVGGFAAIGFDNAQYARPREWGVSFTYRF